MQVRFECPACGGHHWFDMPETTIYMTCSRTRKVLQLRLTGGGDVRAAIVDPETLTAAASSEDE